MTHWMKRALLLSEDPPVDGGGKDADSGGGDAHKFAGKYETPSDLEAGYQEQRELIGLDRIEGELVGKDGRFASYEALEAAYTDEAKLRTRPKKTPKKESIKDKAKLDKPEEDLTLDEPEDEDDGGAAAAEDEEDWRAIAIKAQLDPDVLSEQFVEYGALTDAQYTAIQKARPGFGRKVIDSIARGEVLAAKAQVEQVTAVRRTIADVLGCEFDDVQSQLTSMAKSVPSEERPDMIKRLNDPARCERAAKEIASFHAEKHGSSGDSLAGGGSQGGKGQTVAENPEQFALLSKRAQAGDSAAAKIIDATPQETIAEWMRS